MTAQDPRLDYALFQPRLPPEPDPSLLSADIGLDLRKSTYRLLQELRQFEKRAYDLFMQGLVKGTSHLSLGQEAVAAGFGVAMREDDYTFCTYRGHAHTLVRGAPMGAMMGELLGRANGICGGKGGSMHIADTEKGMLGANGIVGGGIPLATGAALSAKVRKTGGVAISFFGDGASNQGTFHESLNLAAILKLPVVYVVENNGYGEATPMEFVTPVRDLAARAAAYAIPGVIADGMDFFDVWEKAGEAIARARRGEGPTLLECKTYRYYGHHVGDVNRDYRTREEERECMSQHDPLQTLAGRLTAQKLVEADVFERIQTDVKAEIDAGVQFALAAPYPDPRQVDEDVYA